ncbi:MAG: phospholipase D family protein [Planctomycetota bacterium]
MPPPSRATWVALLSLALLPACTSWPKPDPQVDAALLALRATQVTPADPIPSELLELADELFAAEDGRHFVGILHTGADAFTSRIHLIRAARSSIEIQTFNWVSDQAGIFLAVELLAAARRGVTVRLLVDQMTQQGKDELARTLVLHENLQIRLYNPLSASGSLSTIGMIGKLSFEFDGLNERMHNKVFLVDDAVAIVGGRNVEEKYFDLDPEFCYLDRDALVVGPVVQEVADSFDAYWVDPVVVRAEYLTGIGKDLLAWAEAGRAPTLEIPATPRCAWAAEPANAYAVESVMPHTKLHAVDRVEYLWDPPGKRHSDGDIANIGDEVLLTEAIRAADTYIVAVSNYLVLTESAMDGLADFHKDSPDVPFLYVTNSLAATGNIPCYAIARKQRFRQLRNGLHIYEMRPVPVDIRTFCPRYDALLEEAAEIATEERGYEGRFAAIEVAGPQFAIHAKTIVVDGDVVLVGSHNFDPRSSRYNTEAGLLIWDEALGAEVEDEIRLLLGDGNSWAVALKRRIPVWTAVSSAFARLSRSLPIFDIWPYRHHTCFQLREGGREVLMSDPTFFENYESVGQFPGVDSDWKAGKTRFFGSFAGFVRPLL